MPTKEEVMRLLARCTQHEAQAPVRAKQRYWRRQHKQLAKLAKLAGLIA